MLAARVTVLVALAVPAAVAGVRPLEIEVRARALRPGDPVRIDVLAPGPVATLRGEFLARSVHFVRSGKRAERERWSGWSMIDVDRPPGTVAVEVRGTTVDGRTLAGTRAVTIEPWQFPSERLTVEPRYVEPPRAARQRLARERARLAEVYRTRRAVAPSARPFAPPVPGRATSAFGTRRMFNGRARAPHSGLDLRASTGTPVHVSGPGVVALAQDLYYSGNTVIVDHGGGLFTIYAHLSQIHTREGDTLDTGDRLGLSGATGRVTGPHLHWGAKIGDVPFDPTALLDPALW